MTLPAILAAIEHARYRRDVVPIYRELIRGHAGTIGEPWTSVNSAIVAKWSTSTREWIKREAWKGMT